MPRIPSLVTDEYNAMLCKDIEEVEVVKAAIWEMEPYKAPGPDGFTILPLLQIFPAYSIIVLSTFTHKISISSFPSGLGRPFHKSGGYIGLSYQIAQPN